MARVLRGNVRECFIRVYNIWRGGAKLCVYHQVIPEPRCIDNIKSGLEKGRYKDAMDVYTDLSLVFWNALFYNEPKSQIALDAETLKVRPIFSIS